MSRYEFLQLLVTNMEPLNKAGDDGWEMIAVDNNRAYFKREKKTVRVAKGEEIA